MQIAIAHIGLCCILPAKGRFRVPRYKGEALMLSSRSGEDFFCDPFSRADRNPRLRPLTPRCGRLFSGIGESRGQKILHPVRSAGAGRSRASDRGRGGRDDHALPRSGSTDERTHRDRRSLPTGRGGGLARVRRGRLRVRRTGASSCGSRRAD